jgi:hypothetical protein
MKTVAQLRENYREAATALLRLINMLVAVRATLLDLAEEAQVVLAEAEAEIAAALEAIAAALADDDEGAAAAAQAALVAAQAKAQHAQMTEATAMALIGAVEHALAVARQALVVVQIAREGLKRHAPAEEYAGAVDSHARMGAFR